MELWFSDYHTEKVKVSVKVQKQLFGLQTEFQRIDVFDSDEFGRFLSADGSIVFSEKDEFIYDEMVVHIPMAVHPNVKHVLVIGGGDGGVARELGHYKEIETIDVVEPDRVFVEVCKEYFPDNACGLSDPRVTVYYEDGLRFLRSKQNMYDLIINDAIDPLGHNAGLFTKEFYGNCYRALKEDGIMVYQHGSPFYDEDEESCRVMHRKASHSFPVSRVYQAIKTSVEDFGNYDIVFVGYPIWYGSMATPMQTFLHNHASKLAGKRIALFASSGSSGISASVDEARTLCSGATFTETLLLTSSTLSQMGNRIRTWLETLGASRENNYPSTSTNVKITVGNRTITATMEDNAAAQ